MTNTDDKHIDMHVDIHIDIDLNVNADLVSAVSINLGSFQKGSRGSF